MISIEQRIEYERLEHTALELGIPAERFREICGEVESMARASVTWGRIGERLDELRRRIIEEAHTSNWMLND